MASIDDFDPRLIAEFTQHLNPSALGQTRPWGMPQEYYHMGAQRMDASYSRAEQKDPAELSPPQGEVVWKAEEYLKRVNIDLLRMHIRTYNKKSQKRMTRPEIRRELFRVLRAPGTASIIIPFRHFELPEGTDLYRARRIQHSAQIRTQGDVWMAPPSYIGAGRLNDAGEPLLYTASNPLTAAYEVHPQPGDIVAMSHFRTTRRILGLDIADDITVKGLRIAEEKKLELLLRFLLSVFSQNVPPNESFRYIAPDLIVKEIINPFPDIFSGWRYRSIADPRHLAWAMNFAIKGAGAAELVDYVGTEIVQVDPSEGLEGRLRMIMSLRGASNGYDLLHTPLPS